VTHVDAHVRRITKRAAEHHAQKVWCTR
jgi:hypothetical protein